MITKTFNKQNTGITAGRFLAPFVAIIMSVALVPAIAGAADGSNYEPPDKLRKDRLKAPETKVELTETGRTLADMYAAMLRDLQADIRKQLPQIDAAKQKALSDALAFQKLAFFRYENAHRNWRRGYYWKSVDPQKYRQDLKELPGEVEDWEMKLKNALAMPDTHERKSEIVEETKKQLEKTKKELAELPGRLAKAEERLESIKKNEPELTRQVEEAEAARKQAQAEARQALLDTGLYKLLPSDHLDAKLAKAMVLSHASPYWLAAYAQQGPEQANNIKQLLADPDLMIQMLVADGPVWEKYGPAYEIYRAIQKADPEASAGLPQRLALAVALEHAVPVRLETWGSNIDENEAPQYADPLKRYQSYKEAYQAGELDPAFENFDTWNLCMVVDGTAPDEINEWGRQMLRSYRPDLITLADEDWRYVKSVVTDVSYTSKYYHLGFDREDLQRYQNILSTGGICGRRAWFGRFILRAFGIPTTARSQPGHAALVRWSPNGWVPCLGGGWGTGNRNLLDYPTDLDFLAGTQAREDDVGFMQVKRAHWIGGVLGESLQYGYHKNLRGKHYSKYAKKSVDEIEVPEFWQCTALVRQNMINEDLKSEIRMAVGEGLGESDEATEGDTIAPVAIPESERKITVDAKGTIHIPAVATSYPTNNTDIIRYMPSNLDGWQMHYSRFGGADTFSYTIDAPRPGKYHLTARLVTPAPKQHLFLRLNGGGERVDVALPYTMGLWGELAPVEVELAKGRNVLTFYRGHEFQRGVTLRDFQLTPAR